MNLFCLTAIISIIFLGLFIIGCWNYSSNSVLEKIWLCIYSPIVTLIIWFFATGAIGLLIGNFPDKKQVPSNLIEIVAIGDGHSSEGSFFLGCGTIKDESYYFFYKKLSNGGYVQDKVKVSDATIFEDDTKKPGIQRYSIEFVNKAWDSWAFATYTSHVDIIVPKGSIKQNYNFDLN